MNHEHTTKHHNRIMALDVPMIQCLPLAELMICYSNYWIENTTYTEDLPKWRESLEYWTKQREMIVNGTSFLDYRCDCRKEKNCLQSDRSKRVRLIPLLPPV